MYEKQISALYTFPQQRALSMIFRAYSCPVDLSKSRGRSEVISWWTGDHGDEIFRIAHFTLHEWISNLVLLLNVSIYFSIFFIIFFRKLSGPSGKTHSNQLWQQYCNGALRQYASENMLISTGVFIKAGVQWVWCCSPLHTLLHHSKVSISDHFSNLVLFVDDGGRDGSIPIDCEVTRKDNVFVFY